jgi:hypothetical protein
MPETWNGIQIEVHRHGTDSQGTTPRGVLLHTVDLIGETWTAVSPDNAAPTATATHCASPAIQPI